MTLVQFLAIALALLFFTKTAADFRKKKISARSFIFWALIWTMILIVAFLPRVTVFLGGILGVERGIDVAVYFSIVFIFFILFEIIKKITKIEQEITKIVSEQVLKNFENEREN